MVERQSLNLAPAILDLLRRERPCVGARLFETKLARHFDVSRAPVRAALSRLAEAGIVSSEPNRGFVLRHLPEGEIWLEAAPRGDANEALYMAIASDHFDGVLPEIVTEQELLRQYGGTHAELARVLVRIVSEGWVERQKGYGWRFLDVLRLPEAYAQITRLRRQIEPAGLLEPTYRHDLAMIAGLRQRQSSLLEKGLSTFSASDLFRDGCWFHETIAAASGNPFLLDTLRRFNAMRRLFAYRSVIPNHEYLENHIREHLHLLDLMEQDDRPAAARFLGEHIR